MFGFTPKTVAPEVHTRVIEMKPDMSKFTQNDVLAEKIYERHYRLSLSIADDIGKQTNRERVARVLGQMAELGHTLSMLTGASEIITGFQLDKDTVERKISAGYYTPEQVADYRAGRTPVIGS